MSNSEKRSQRNFEKLCDMNSQLQVMKSIAILTFFQYNQYKLSFEKLWVIKQGSELFQGTKTKPEKKEERWGKKKWRKGQ